MKASDSDLLNDYIDRHSEAAFAELVSRHLNLVYAAALRQVRATDLAQDVAQSVFSDLARQAAGLKPGTILTAWLYQVTRRTAIDTIRRESRRQARERLAAEMAPMNAPADWSHIEPVLDEAMAALDETDRAALLLRFFDNKSLREVGAALGTSDDAAQKRVSRAIERLREFLAKRGVAVGAASLLGLISANAVHAAPAGLAATISAAAVLSGASAVTSSTAVVTKALAMTTLQKTLIATALVTAVSTGVYEATQASHLRIQNEELRQAQAAPAVTPSSLSQQERDDLSRQLAALRAENGRLGSNTSELLRLRAEVTQLRGKIAPTARSGQPAPALDSNDPAVQRFLAARAAAQRIANCLQQMPDKEIPEISLLEDRDWLEASEAANFESDTEIRKTLARLRGLAKKRLPMAGALNAYLRAHDNQLPTDVSQLKPFFTPPASEVDLSLNEAKLDSILARYTLLHTGNLHDLDPKTTWLIAEKAPVDKEYDSRAKFGNGTSTVISTGLGEAGDPDDKSY